MTIIFALLALFLAIGVFARSYNRNMRILMGVGIIVLIFYVYIHG